MIASSRLDATLLEGSEQHLPIPLGGARPAHAHRGRINARHWWLARWRLATAAVGLVAGAAGVALTLTSSDTAVFADGWSVHVGSSVLMLHPEADSAPAALYTGDAALVINPGATGKVRASAVTTIRGARSVGTCQLQWLGVDAVERCQFTVAGRSFTASDVFSAAGHAWQRQYSDGVRVRVQVPATARLVPVPFPVGA